jgi:hypothetical protein
VTAGERWRRLLLGLPTLLGLGPRGWFIPHRYADGAPPPGYPALEPYFRAAEPEMATLIGEMEAWLTQGGPARLRFGARFDQDWFPRLDALAAEAMVRRHRPRRIVEVGSGHSTRFLADAAAEVPGGVEIVCVDPAPRRPIDRLPVRHLAMTAQAADPAVWDGLCPGDILFVDSSHVAMPGSDVDRLFLDVLARLPAGVLVHVHDILLPDPYPPAWQWRGYNEQMLVAALITGGGFDILFSSHWAATRMAARLAAGPCGAVPLVEGAIEGGLWLRKRPALS